MRMTLRYQNCCHLMFVWWLILQTTSHWSCILVLAQNNCTLCMDGSVPSGQYPGGLDCSVVAANIRTFDKESTVCVDTQVTAFQYCNCNSLPDGRCPLCGNESPVGFPDLKLIGDDTRTCRMVEFPSECLMVPYDAAWYCGCSSTQRPMNASLCDNEDPVVHTNRVLLPNSNCLQYDRMLGAVGQQASSIDTSVFGDLLPAYCGCPGTLNVAPPQQCSLCTNELPNPSRRIIRGSTSATCAQLQTMSEYITNDSFCSQLQNEYGTCCQATEAPVTLAPSSMAPIVAPAAVPAPSVEASSSSSIWSGNVVTIMIINLLLVMMLR